MAGCRNQAILLDSDSDGMDSEDEGSVVCGMDSDDGMSTAASDAEGSFCAPTGRTASQSTPAGPQPAGRRTTRPTKDNAAQATQQMPQRASSKRVRKGGGESAQEQQGDGLIKASYPAGSEPPSGAAAVKGASAAPSAAAVLKGTSMRSLPIALMYHGAILSDSDSDDDEPTAAAAPTHGKVGLEGPTKADPAAAVAVPQQPVVPAVAAPVAAVAPRPVVLVAPPSRGKAAAVRQAVADAAQAAGRAVAASQAAGSRQAGLQAVVSADAAGSSNPIVLTPPKRAAFSAASGSTAASAGPPRSPAAVPLPAWKAAVAVKAAAWEPTFPQDEAVQQQPEGKWAEVGWSNVAL